MENVFIHFLPQVDTRIVNTWQTLPVYWNARNEPALSHWLLYSLKTCGIMMTISSKPQYFPGEGGG